MSGLFKAIALRKRWKVSEALLRSAHHALPREKEKDERFRSLEQWFLEYLEHNEHELALDMLQELGELCAPRCGFWKELIRAAENMERQDRVPYLQNQFDEALDRWKT